LAVAHKVINSPKAKTDHIAHLLHLYLNNHQPDYVRTGGHGPNP
jgi:hypothetical protein